MREVLFTSLEGVFALRTSFSLLSAPLSHETSACAYPTHSLTYLHLVGSHDLIPPEALGETADDFKSRFVSCNLDFDHWRR